MTKTTTPFDWPHMAKIIEYKNRYEELVPNISTPRTRKTLNVANAEWFLKNAKKFNKQDDVFVELNEICTWYLNAFQTKYEVPVTEDEDGVAA